jgi:hypothetical protein
MNRIPKCNRRPNPSVVSQLGILVACAIVSGCGRSGPELAAVTGRVTIDGRPFEDIDVFFQPDGGKRPSIGRTDADGRYELFYTRGKPGALVGPHTVRLTVVTAMTRGPQVIPPRYNTESELRREVEPSKKNVFDFELSTQAK